MRPSVGVLAVIVAAYGLASHPASGQLPRRVTAVGQAAGTGPRAEDEAIKAAQRKAVEMACGLFLNAQSETENYALVYDRILSQAVGYVAEWKELRRWEENDATFIEIQAVVAVADFERDWAAFAHLKEKEGNPRVVVVIVEDNDVDDLKPPVVNGVCQSRLEHFFLNHDVQLMDRQQSENVRQRDVNQAAMDDDVTRLAAIAAEFKAEVLILGRAEARRAGTVQLGEQWLYRWDATLNVRAIQTDSAALLMSNSYRPQRTFTGTRRGTGDEAFRALADEVAEQVLRDVGQAWHKRSAARRILAVKFSSVSRQQAKAIIETLAEHRGVVGGPQGTKLRNLNHGVADVEVDWKFDLNQLADTIEALAVEGMGFTIVEQTADRLDVKVVHE